LRASCSAFQLPLSGSPTVESFIFATPQGTFNSLSRDHRRARRADPLRVGRILSTPSLGITYVLAAPPVSPYKILSTPSLGITQSMNASLAFALGAVAVTFNSLSRDH
jgi:hypothetical protein